MWEPRSRQVGTEGKKKGETSDWVTRMEPSVLSVCDPAPLYPLPYLSLETVHKAGNATIPIVAGEHTEAKKG